jgi:predicted ATP-dependent endonuclease of OLD family
MNQWEVIFNRKLHDKQIRLTCDIDSEQNIYVRFKLIDGGEIFDIADRSAGFRWFFAFILLTQYRGYRNSGALFLYDEPASTLHSSAQKELLNCFKRIPEHFKVLYSTHSHYLINPEWLDSTYIVKNDAVGNEVSEIELDASKTDVSVTPYRVFVSKNGNQVSYYQPILDVLNYSPSQLTPNRPCVLVEGKNDFYLFKYLSEIGLKLVNEFDWIPCMGSGTADSLIALHAGWGNNFILFLDSDGEGQKQHQRYLEKFGGLLNNRVLTYGSIDSKWQNIGAEKFVGDEGKLLLQQAVFGDGKYSKKKFNLAVQELLIKRTHIALPTDLEERMQLLIRALEKALGLTTARAVTKETVLA